MAPETQSTDTQHMAEQPKHISMLRGIGWLVLGALLAVLTMEGVLRCLAVNSGWVNPVPTPQQPLIRYEPGAAFVYSRGWNLANVQRGWFNNLGFVSAYDYQVGAPAVAIIGDSYVEAAMIPDGTRVHEQLQPLLPNGVQALGFGQSGADLADDLIMARHAAEHFQLRGLVFVLSPADVLGSGKPRPRGFWFSGHGAATRMYSAAQVQLRNLFYRSSLLSYLLVNLKFAPADLLDDGFNAIAAPSLAEGFDKSASDHLGYFLSQVQMLATREGLRPEAVVLLLDADRAALYAHEAPSALHAALGARARSSGFAVVNLSDAFSAEFARTGLRLDVAAEDSHWNVRAHELAARGVAEVLRRR